MTIVAIVVLSGLKVNVLLMLDQRGRFARIL